MRIAITGASGRVGQQLVPLLVSRGVEPVLLGRDRSKLSSLFQGMEVRTISELRTIKDVVAVLHMASLNNDSEEDAASFQEVNVDLTMQLLEMSRAAGIPRFIFLSSIHALSGNPKSLYAQSKREAAKKLLDAGGMGIAVVHCAAVVGNRLTGRLGLIDTWPRGPRNVALRLAQAIKPTLKIEKLCATVAALAHNAPASNSQFVLTDGQESNKVYHVLRRVMDITASITIIVFAGWLVALAWAAVRRETPGPGFFLQDRVGQNGRIFRCVKLRTMTIDTLNGASHRIGDATITSIGRKLRATKLDEIPQVWNVLRGEMSLVGPRPCLPVQQDVIEARKDYGVLSMVPGITGLAQTEGIDMSTPEMLAKADARYRDIQSISEDLRIIAATARGRGAGDAASKPRAS